MAHLGLTAALLSVLLCPGYSRMVSDPLSALKATHLSTGECSECSLLLLQSTNMISSRSTKVTVYKSLLSLCGRLPPHQAEQCQKQVHIHLSSVLQQNQSPAKSCGLFGLCGDTKPAPAGTEKEQFSPVCTLCVMVVKKLETLLPQNMTEDAIRSLLAHVCSLVPRSYQQQCDDFVQKHGEEIVDFLLSSAAPHTICTLLHLCLLDDTPAPQNTAPSDCDSCRTLSVLSRAHLGLDRDLNQTKAQSFLRSVCSVYPHAIPKCEIFTKVYGSQLLQVLGHDTDSLDPCEAADLCVSRTQASRLGERRCTWGPSYWCRNMQTAQECGNQAFCKKFVWK